MTRNCAQQTILAAIKVDEGKEAKDYPFTERAYTECYKRIPTKGERDKFEIWYNDLKRNFKK